MSDDELRRLYQGALKRRSGGAGPSLEELEALAAGRLSEQESLRLLDLVMANDQLRAEFELLRSVHVASEGKGPAVPGTRPGGMPGRAAPAPARRSRYLALGLAASLLLAVGLWYGLGAGDAAEQTRGADSTVELHAPGAGSVARPPVVLAWAPVEGASSYRVELVNADGVVVLTRQTPDTAIALLPEHGLAPGAYHWWVEAQVPAGHLRSALREVRLQAP